ncbi:type I restriction enzyme S subunit [Malaciobacter marinus]|jgi:type I restriction enzyme S subunit|uniref:Type I restriction enzyme S subunit n=1 Tax=Malaciobacter marinus TaxID=505249 RepID=A0AB36ZZD0_9BACT|nr:restriction endonuclease subunit S [Malaciobacter marinus]PPK62818.1 type I restriction enzyme S subunit [Malaciobacter marinus]
MSKLEKYMTYKDSGVEWLGEIPEHWELLPFKSLLKKNGLIRGPFGSALQTSFFVESGYKVYEQKNAIYNDLILGKSYINKSKYNELKRFEIISNDFLMSCSGTIGKLTKVPEVFEQGIINQAMLIIRTKNAHILDDFFEYLFSSEYILNTILDNSLGSAMKNLVGMSIFKNIKIPLPLKDEQTKIASFLDEKTSQIDKAISQKEKLIELLKERRQITINEAVTKGLDKDVEFKDSGVEWIGEIPKYWEVSKLGTSLKPISIKNKPDLPLLSVTREQGVILRDVDNKDSNHNFIPDDLSPYKMVEKGQFAMNKMKAWQGSYGISDYTGIVSPAYYIFELNGIEPTFFHKAIRSSVYVPFFIKASDGVRIGQWDLSKSRMKEIPFYIPPTKDEQTKIVEYIETQTSKIDNAIELQQNYIAKLKEYKASLIDSVVTGKVRVA